MCKKRGAFAHRTPTSHFFFFINSHAPSLPLRLLQHPRVLQRVTSDETPRALLSRFVSPCHRCSLGRGRRWMGQGGVGRLLEGRREPKKRGLNLLSTSPTFLFLNERLRRGFPFSFSPHPLTPSSPPPLARSEHPPTHTLSRSPSLVSFSSTFRIHRGRRTGRHARGVDAARARYVPQRLGVWHGRLDVVLDLLPLLQGRRHSHLRSRPSL